MTVPGRFWFFDKNIKGIAPNNLGKEEYNNLKYLSGMRA